MKGPILFLLFIFSAVVVRSQAVESFILDVEHPCEGQWFTLTLPLNCSFQRLVRTELSITPKPDETQDVVDHTPGHQGVVGVRVKYIKYQTATIDVHGPYTCSGVIAGNATKTFRMSPNITLTPAISGLPDKLYSGDVTTVTAPIDPSAAPNDQPGYLWQLTQLSAVSGTINIAAIVSATSRVTQIKWPRDFVGEVELKLTMSRCASSRETKTRVIILTPPDPFVAESTTPPPIHCAGSVVRYRLHLLNNGFSVTRTSLIMTGNAEVSVFTSLNAVPVEWLIKWNSSGSLKVDYTVSDGKRNWTGVTAPGTFEVVQLSAGKIHPISPGIYCSPYSITLTLDNNPTTDYVWQYCNTSDCGVSSTGWITNDPPTSQTFSGLSKNTSFRTKVTEQACGVFTSSPVLITITPSPVVVASDATISSGGTFNIPASNVPFATISVSVDTIGVRGASGFTTTQGPSAGGILTTQTLTASGPLDGRVVYKIRASNGICSNTDTAMVTVLKPVGEFRDGNENYIITRQPQNRFTSDVGLQDKTEVDITESIQYFDGLGRVQQTVSTRISPAHHDVIQPVLYDQFGRETRKYLPYVSSGNKGNFDPDPFTRQLQFYQTNDDVTPSDPAPFSETLFEMSPLNRTLKQGAPGIEWIGHSVKHEYLLNTIADSIIRFNYDHKAGSISMSATSWYSPGILYCNKTIDEHNNDVLEFLDKLNRTVCRKVKAGPNIYASTYYIYDDIGNLVVVVPPEATRSMKSSTALK